MQEQLSVLNIQNFCMTCGCNFAWKLLKMNLLGEPRSVEDCLIIWTLFDIKTLIERLGLDWAHSDYCQLLN